MKVLSATAFAFLLAGLLMAGGAAAAGKDDPGAKIFTGNKCNKCHTVKSLGIDLLKDKESEKEAQRDFSEYGKSPTPADTLQKFLAKEVELKNQKGEMKKHKKKFELTDPDFKALYGWLASLK